MAGSSQKLAAPFTSKKEAADFLKHCLMREPHFKQLVADLEIWWRLVLNDLDSVQKRIVNMAEHLDMLTIEPDNASSPRYKLPQLKGQVKQFLKASEKMGLAPTQRAETKRNDLVHEFARVMEMDALAEWKEYERGLVDNIIDSTTEQEKCFVDQPFTVCRDWTDRHSHLPPGAISQQLVHVLHCTTFSRSNGQRLSWKG